MNEVKPEGDVSTMLLFIFFPFSLAKLGSFPKGDAERNIFPANTALNYPLADLVALTIRKGFIDANYSSQLVK